MSNNKTELSPEQRVFIGMLEWNGVPHLDKTIKCLLQSEGEAFDDVAKTFCTLSNQIGKKALSFGKLANTMKLIAVSNPKLEEVKQVKNELTIGLKEAKAVYEVEMVRRTMQQIEEDLHLLTSCLPYFEYACKNVIKREYNPRTLKTLCSVLDNIKETEEEVLQSLMNVLQQQYMYDSKVGLLRDALGLSKEEATLLVEIESERRTIEPVEQVLSEPVQEPIEATVYPESLTTEQKLDNLVYYLMMHGMLSKEVVKSLDLQQEYDAAEKRLQKDTIAAIIKDCESKKEGNETLAEAVARYFLTTYDLIWKQ